MSAKVFKTPEGTISFPHIVEAYAYGNNKPKYSINLIIPKTEESTTWAKEVQLHAMSLIEVKFPDPAKRPKKFKLSLKDGDSWAGDDGLLKKDQYPEYADSYVVQCGKQVKDGRPPTFNGQVQPIAPEEVYAGSIGKLLFKPYAYDNQAKGVSFDLQGVQKIADGEKLGGDNVKAEDYFQTETTTTTTTDTTVTESTDMFS